MPRLNEMIPDAEVFLALEPEELAAAILEMLIELGVSAELDGSDIIFKPIEKIPPDLIPDIRACKSQIIALLHVRTYERRFPHGTVAEIQG